MKSQRRQVGARFVARARGAFGFARLSPKNSARNSASLGQATGRRANVAQHGQDLTENGGVNAEPTQASVQFAGMQESLRWGIVLPGSQTADSAAAGRTSRDVGAARL